MGAVARLLREQDEEIARLTARVAEMEAEVARLREVERLARDFILWAAQNDFTDPENMLVCAEWHNLTSALEPRHG